MNRTGDNSRWQRSDEHRLAGQAALWIWTGGSWLAGGGPDGGWAGLWIVSRGAVASSRGKCADRPTPVVSSEFTFQSIKRQVRRASSRHCNQYYPLTPASSLARSLVRANKLQRVLGREIAELYRLRRCRARSWWRRRRRSAKTKALRRATQVVRSSSDWRSMQKAPRLWTARKQGQLQSQGYRITLEISHTAINDKNFKSRRRSSCFRFPVSTRQHIQQACVT